MFVRRFSSLLASLLCFGLAAPSAMAAEAKTEGGIELVHSDDYWFKMNGIVKVDATLFLDGDKDRRTDFPGGANVRSVENTFNGGIGKDLSYTVVLSFESGVDVNDAYVTYSGLRNTEISVGQVISPFCLENAKSGKWVPFLERSLGVIALRPCLGIGVNINNWGERYMFNLASTAPLHGSNGDAAGIMHRSDKLTNTARFVYAPYLAENQVFHLGGSFVYAENSPTFRNGAPNTDGRRFSTRPEARARNTLAIINSGNSMFVKHYEEYGAEAAVQQGPLLVQAEWLQANVHRQNNPNVRFYGWHTQAAYVLTGESRSYNMSSASFGGVKPKCRYGAWEVAARYSMVSLNDEDIHGGSEHNVAASLGWYVNNHLKIMGNYIYASIDPTRQLGANNPNPTKRHLNILGFRTQVVW